MGIRCIALDLDGTTLDSQGRLSEGNRCALERAIKEGIHIVIASGRAFDSLPEEVLEIKGIEYAITSNGAAIYHVPTGKRLHGYTLSEQSVRKILEVTEGKEVVYETFIEGKAYADSAYVEDPLKYGATEKGVSYIQRTRQREENISEFILRHIRILDSIDIVVPNGEMKNHV